MADVDALAAEALQSEVGRPQNKLFYLMGLGLFFLGLSVAIMSLAHNYIKVSPRIWWDQTNTGYSVYGPLDVLAGIVGAVFMVAGILLIFYSER